jgi:hypothetical protein
MKILSTRKRRFAKELLSSQDPEIAAFKANCHKTQAYDLVNDEDVIVYYDYLLNNQTIGLKQKIISRLLEIIDADPLEYLTVGGKLKPLTRLKNGKCLESISSYNNGSCHISVPDKLEAIKLLLSLIDIREISFKKGIRDYIKDPFKTYGKDEDDTEEGDIEEEE